jgi:ATPase subunit of ABC transporter with duplicated ATPase domains
MLGTQNLGKSYGGRTLFANVSLQMNPGSRYGLVGANGSGKSTFMKVLCGDEQATEGTITIPARVRMSVLRQDRFLDDEQRILDQCMMGDAVVWSALQEQTRLIDGGEERELNLAELEDVIRTHDGYTLEARASGILEGLGIPVAVHREPLRVLSGGFKLRVLLAQVLLGGPDLLMLDEPTNHLDILSIRWLERFLAGYQGCAVVISHDQRFLDNIATHVLDVDYETITLYTGNFTKFGVQKADVRMRKEAEIARTEKIIAEKRAFVDRFGAKATKAKQAQSRLKQIEKIEVEELAESSRRTPSFRFTPARASGRDVLAVEEIAKSYGDKAVLKDISITIRRGEKVAIIGPNGLGKSTLLKIATGNLVPDSGTTKWGHETRVGYFAQDHKDLLSEGKMTPIEYIWAADPMAATTFVRGQLGQVLFSGDDVNKRVDKLSGGEAARLIFCRLMVEKPNVLVLDEPTNHLDMESIAGLADALKRYDGTVIFVSHDRWFVSELASRVLEITKDGLRDFPGTYTEYLAQSGDDHLDAQTVVLKAKTERAPDAGNRKAGASVPPPGQAAGSRGGSVSTSKGAPSVPPLSWEEQKKRNNRLKALPGLRDRALAAMEQAEARKKQLHALYTEPGFFERTPPAEARKLEEEEAKLEHVIADKLKEWEACEAELSALGAS